MLEMTIVIINRDRARRLCTLCPLLPPSQTFQSILPGAYRQAYTSLECGWVTRLKIMSFLLQKKHFSNAVSVKQRAPRTNVECLQCVLTVLFMVPFLEMSIR